MTPRPAALFVASALLVLVAASGYLAWTVLDYIASPVAPSSTSGNRVFLVDGELAAYPPFELGLQPGLAGGALVLFVLAVFVAAYSRSASRASTADSNARAHTR